MTISTGMLVFMEYTLKNDRSETLDSNVGRDPLSYVHGQGQIVRGLEAALAGKKVGDSVSVVVQPEDGYGARSEEAVVEVPLDRVPENARQVGTRLQGQDAEGTPIYPLVHEIKAGSVMLDFNHPLAGETLHFDVKILRVQAQSEPSGSVEAPAQD